MPCARFNAKVWNQNGTESRTESASSGSTSIGNRSATWRSASVIANWLIGRACAYSTGSPFAVRTTSMLPRVAFE